MLLLSILSLFSKKLYIVFITLLYIKPVDIGIIWIFIFGLCLYYILWTRFVSATFTVYDVVFRVRCLWVQWFLVYNLCWCFWIFCFHICSIFKSGVFPLIYIGCCCIYWFLWVPCDFDGWIFLWLINLHLSLMFLLSILSRCLKNLYIFFITLLYIKP